MRRRSRRDLAARFLPVLIAGLVAVRCGEAEGGRPVAPAPAAQTTGAAATPPAAEFAKLQGRWLRPDGDYVLEIRGVDRDGKMDAGYFNPRAIHVATAAASATGAAVNVFIELRDENYPGSTYALTYDPAADRLNGTYFQAAIRETFEVQFVRLRP